MRMALEWLGILADAASLIGLIITVIVWVQVRSLRNDFLSRARLPQLSGELKVVSAALLRSYQESDDLSRDAHTVIARLLAMLDNLLAKTNQPQRVRIKKLQILCGRPRSRASFLKSIRQTRLSRDGIWEIYCETEGLIESLEQTVKDRNWS